MVTVASVVVPESLVEVNQEVQGLEAYLEAVAFLELQVDAQVLQDLVEDLVTNQEEVEGVRQELWQLLVGCSVKIMQEGQEVVVASLEDLEN